MTLLSRISGFIRDMLIARLFGADAATDAFFVAFKVPDFMRRLFSEGAFSQAFVPVLAEYKENTTREALKEFVARSAGTLALCLFVATLAGVLLAPILIWLFAPGFAWHGDSYELSVLLLRITFPYLFFISLTALAASLLNTFGRFAIPAMTPLLLNLCMIAAALWLAPRFAEPVVALACGVSIGGITQLAFQVPALDRMDLLKRPMLGFQHPGVRRIAKSMLPAIFGVSVTQINLLVDTLIASFLVSGSISWLYYADRLVEFPLGLFGIALATAILPNLSQHHVAQDRASFSQTLDWGLRWVILIAAPATIGLFMLAEAILSVLFQNQEFSEIDVVKAGESLKAYSLGLIGFMLIKVLVPCFSSRQDLKIPLRYGFHSLWLHLILSLVLVFPLAHAGLAFATSLAALFNSWMLARILLVERIYVPEPGWIAFLLRTVVANSAMATVLHFSMVFIDFAELKPVERMICLFLWIGAAAIVYAIALFGSGLRAKDLGFRRIQ